MPADAFSPASRMGTAASAWSNRAGRIDGRSWRDVERALRLGQKRDAHAVEIHGIRFVLRSAQKPQVDPTGGGCASAQATRRHVEQTRATAAQKTAAPNSAQRRSARRLQKFLEAKLGSGPAKALPLSSSVEPPSTRPARVDPDVRAGAAAMDTTEDDRRGRKRAGSGSPGCAPPPPAHEAAEAPQQKQPRPAGVGGRGREGRGLAPLPPADYRRMRAESAREDRREKGGRG